jgi:hypothetical protein
MRVVIEPGQSPLVITVRHNMENASVLTALSHVTMVLSDRIYLQLPANRYIMVSINNDATIIVPAGDGDYVIVYGELGDSVVNVTGIRVADEVKLLNYLEAILDDVFNAIGNMIDEVEA